LEVALGVGRGWTGEYVLDFEKVLVESAYMDERNGSSNSDEDEDGKERPVFSLLTGTYRHPKRYGDGDAHQPQIEDPSSKPSSSAIILRNQDSAVVQSDSAAGQFLQQRTYQGLDIRLGQDAPSMLEQGRSGVARGYQDDVDRMK